jgi:hypothetical protein
VLGAVVLVVLGSVGADAPRAFTVDARPVPLNGTDPDQTRLGSLLYRGGLWLRSADPRFGGLSGLRVSADGKELIAVSDCGRGFTATLEHGPGGNLIGLRDATLSNLAGPGGRALEREEIDAEGLAADPDQGLLVIFEGRPPRIWSYHGPGPPLTGPPEPRLAPPFGDGCDRNQGPEALAVLTDGRVFIACEGGDLDEGVTAAWLGRGDRWVSRPYPLEERETGVGDVFRPTGATLLPDGDVLVLERRFPPIEARIMRLSRQQLEGEGRLAPREVARFTPPLTVDNFEGLDAWVDPSGATLLYVVSDDNGCGKRQVVVAPRALQRTLLLMFEIPDQEVSPRAVRR